jgi:hypothetical protein
MRFRLLGPLEVVGEERECVLLATLLLAANRLEVVTSPASRVQEIRTHGLKTAAGQGGPDQARDG